MYERRLYSGLALITIAGIVLSPVIHRFLHKFHLQSEKEPRTEEAGRRARPPR